MKKIYMMALAVFAAGTLSAQSNNGGDTKTSPQRKTAQPSPVPMQVQKLPAEQRAKTTINATEQKAVENKKNKKATESK